MRLVKGAAILAAAMFAVFALCAAAYVAWPRILQRIVMRKKSTAVERVSTCGELVSYKCKYTSIVYKDRPLAINKNTKGYSVVRVKGVIMGGVSDISKIKLDVSEDGKSVAVLMPHCKILENGIESEEGLNEEGTFLRVRLEDVFTSIDDARKEVEDDLVANGFLSDADKYAQEAMRQMMNALKFSNVEVKMS